MSDPQKCPQCGIELPADAPAGLCPRCLVAAGLESEAGSETNRPKSDPEAPTVDIPSPGSRFLPPLPSELADKFPQLEIVELLGHGGMGAVYKARQTNLDRLVALKIIRPEATQDATFAERFNREAKTLARLSHQHIVGVYDFGEAESSASEDQPARPLYYFLMEYVDGVNLRQLMRAGELTPEQALAIVPQICDALQYAHDEGVVHRDIKPENILLDKRGRVKIADFGLAKLTTRSEAEFTLTGTHQVMGTLRYMAPEQMEGTHAVDHRVDIYSLGVVFYEMLTGEAPMGHFDPPSKKVEIDVRLDDVVLRSLARDPERRYQQASDVKLDVASISSTVVPTKRPISKSPFASDRIADSPHFSRKAILGALWAFLPVVSVVAISSTRLIPRLPDGVPGTPLEWEWWLYLIAAVLSVVGIAGLLAPLVTTLLGLVAISDIRHSRGRITGLGLAFFDALFFPLLLLDGGIYHVTYHVILAINEDWCRPDAVIPLVITLAICVPLDIWICRRAWQSVAGGGEHSNASRTAQDAGPSGLPIGRFLSTFTGWIILFAAVVALSILSPWKEVSYEADSHALVAIAHGFHLWSGWIAAGLAGLLIALLYADGVLKRPVAVWRPLLALAISIGLMPLIGEETSNRSAFGQQRNAHIMAVDPPTLWGATEERKRAFACFLQDNAERDQQISILNHERSGGIVALVSACCLFLASLIQLAALGYSHLASKNRSRVVTPVGSQTSADSDEL